MNEDVEPNVFYEPRPAVAPFYVIPVGTVYYPGPSYTDRAEAEKAARESAEWMGKPYYVVGAVSISSVPNLPVKASTRALV